MGSQKKNHIVEGHTIKSPGEFPLMMISEFKLLNKFRKQFTINDLKDCGKLLIILNRKANVEKNRGKNAVCWSKKRF